MKITKKTVVTPEAEARAKQLIERGYYQISAAYREVACLPQGVTGRQALYAAAVQSGDNPDRAWKWAFGMQEHHATDQFLRVYAGPELRLTLTVAEYIAFRKLGGRSAV